MATLTVAGIRPNGGEILSLMDNGFNLAERDVMLGDLWVSLRVT